jgi:hypothetical protein
MNTDQRPFPFEPPREHQRLTCCDCGSPFVLTQTDHLFYASRGLCDPRRCGACRARRRATAARVPQVTT